MSRIQRRWNESNRSSFESVPHCSPLFSCLYHTGGELMNFEHPKNKMKAITRVDNEGAVCGAAFKVDLFAKTKSMPRVGSHANWASSQEA
ncbi:putative stem-specific protein TSJT1 [Helianthus debilis subsp. tardiflorus]